MTPLAIRLFITILGLLPLACATSGCLEKHAHTIKLPPPIEAGDSPEIRPEIRDTLVAYLEATRKWSRSEYVLQIDGPSNDLEGYMVGKISGSENIKVGGGDFFVIYVDPRTMKVVREMHFQ